MVGLEAFPSYSEGSLLSSAWITKDIRTRVYIGSLSKRRTNSILRTFKDKLFQKPTLFWYKVPVNAYQRAKEREHFN